MCGRFFADRQSAEAAADQLVGLCEHLGFEGWLINIENELTPEEVQVALHFMGYLRAQLKRRMPHALLIWYDAVTVEGQLTWQNSVTPLNAPFLDLADGIMVNYGWNAETPQTAAAAVLDKQIDSTPSGNSNAATPPEQVHSVHSVFMGVDVFGRGTFGGGGMDCDVAIRAAMASGLSVALFAPGWVFETHDRAGFEQLQEQFWSKIEAALPASRPIVTHLPFCTAFNPGCGRWCAQADGTACAEAPWYCLSSQQPEPHLRPARLGARTSFIVIASPSPRLSKSSFLEMPASGGMQPAKSDVTRAASAASAAHLAEARRRLPHATGAEICVDRAYCGSRCLRLYCGTAGPQAMQTPSVAAGPCSGERSSTGAVGLVEPQADVAGATVLHSAHVALLPGRGLSVRCKVQCACGRCNLAIVLWLSDRYVALQDLCGVTANAHGVQNANSSSETEAAGDAASSDAGSSHVPGSTALAAPAVAAASGCRALVLPLQQAESPRSLSLAEVAQEAAPPASGAAQASSVPTIEARQRWTTACGEVPAEQLGSHPFLVALGVMLLPEERPADPAMIEAQRGEGGHDHAHASGGHPCETAPPRHCSEDTAACPACLYLGEVVVTYTL